MIMSSTLKFEITNNEFLDFKRKSVARRITNTLLKKGELVRASHCDKCGIQYNTVAHHVDYGQPSKILWLCNSCHGVVHRKGHELNPNSVKQTMLPTLWEEKDYVQISFNIPIENFIAIKKLCQETGKTFSKLMRGCILEKFPVTEQQLKFNFGENKNETQAKISSRVSMLEYDQECLHVENERKISHVWRKRCDLGQKLVKVRSIPKRYGKNARKLQLYRIDRLHEINILRA